VAFSARLRLSKDPDLLAAALEGRIAESRLQMRRGLVGNLYESGVVYRREPNGQEDWQTARDTLIAGSGDCEDLVIWRVAELREQGQAARAAVLPLARRLWHVVVEHADGWYEDPSAVLGMYAPRRVRSHPLMRRRYMTDATEPTDDDLELAALEATEPRAVEDMARADVDADTIEAAPLPVRPSVRWQQTPRRDGTYDAEVSVMLKNGRTLRTHVHARSRKAALARAITRTASHLRRDALMALVPPQAHTAVAAMRTLVSVARDGQIAAALRRVRSRGLRVLARMLG
jgi:hypothetical protein